ncbi:MAG: hypothetical protein ACRCZF_21685, partial [Gemmataceae bacterium]
GGVGTRNLHRLFGDINGDAAVNTDDADAFGQTFALSQGDFGFQTAFDWNQDAIVSVDDYEQFGSRFGLVI